MRETFAHAVATLAAMTMIASTGLAERQVARMMPEPMIADTGFGSDCAVDGDWAVVGAVYEGAAYIYERISSGWRFAQRIEPGDGMNPEEFGKSVDIDGDFMIIGRPADDIMSFNSGSAYVFQRSDDTWVEVQKLVPSDAFQLDNFGCSVAIEGGMILVGAKYDDDRGHSSGSAYVFERGDAGWKEIKKLVANDGQQGDLAGWDVDIADRVAVVGAWARSTEGLFRGGAFVYEKIDDAWTQTATLTASDAQDNDYFGVSVAADESRIAVGATGAGNGAVYVFDRLESTWEQTARLNGQSGPREYGNALGIGNDRLLVASHMQSVEGKAEAGAVYVYEYIDGVWSEPEFLTAEEPRWSGRFGWSADLDDDDQVISGSTFERVDDMIVGAAYAFTADACPGDLSGDGAVTIADLGILLASYDVDGGGDLDGDGDTDTADLGVLLANFDCVP